MRPILVAACGVLLAFLLSTSVHVPAANAVTGIDGIWSELEANGPAPSARREYAAVYDRVHRRYIVFAGFTNEQGNGYFLFNEVWALTLGATPSWSLLATSGDIPGERHSPQWGYDPTRNRVLVFGGYGSHYPGSPYAYLNDVWELKLNGAPAWNELFPTGSAPAGRLAGAAAYDVLNQRFVGFGGTAGLPVDTWQLDLRGQPEWSTVATNGVRPLGGYGMASIFDPVRNRMLIFGGSTSAAYYGTHNDTWELDLRPDTPSWRQLNPNGTLPVARRTLTAVFDPRRDRMVIFGGWDGTPSATAFLNDTWALSLSTADGAWTQLLPDGPAPHVRCAIAAAYDPRGDRMVLFGGWGGVNLLGDTQFLSWDDAGTGASVTPSAEASDGVAQLHWTTQNTTSPIGAVYRREPGTEWTSIGTFEADALGNVTFEDDSITPGNNYGYQIVVSSEVGDEFVGEVWVGATSGVEEGSPRAAISLNVSPNPARGPIAISFDFPSTAPARLELFDVRGRRVLWREVEPSAAGSGHLVEDTKNYPSGLYYLRLTQSGRSATTRLVVP
jgi:hypothetical protein